MVRVWRFQAVPISSPCLTTFYSLFVSSDPNLRTQVWPCHQLFYASPSRMKRNWFNVQKNKQRWFIPVLFVAKKFVFSELSCDIVVFICGPMDWDWENNSRVTAWSFQPHRLTEHSSNIRCDIVCEFFIAYSRDVQLRAVVAVLSDTKRLSQMCIDCDHQVVPTSNCHLDARFNL